MNKNRKIKETIKKWNQELKNKLNINKNEQLEVFFLPEEWKDENNKDLENIFYHFEDKKILNDNRESIIPNSEFFVMKKERFYELKLEKEFILTDAEFKESKLIVYLGDDNYYFYYINSSNNLCEGYIQSLKRGKDEEIMNKFKDLSPEKFIIFILKETKPDIKNNKIIYNLNNYKIVYKNDKELINNIKINYYNKKQNINTSNKLLGSKQRNGVKQNINNVDKEDNKKSKDLIIRCIIYFFYSKDDINYFICEKDKKEYNFILIDSEWINLFKEKYNYNFYESKIKINKIDDRNYFHYLNIFKDINIGKIKPIPPLNEIKINSMNREYNIYDNYELINPELYDLLIECFGQEKNHKKIELNAIFFEYNYYLIKYNSKMFEVIKAKNESERFLFIGKNNIDEIEDDILNFGYIKWLKNNDVTEYKVASLEISNGVMLHYLPKIKENEEEKYTENNRHPKKRNRSAKKSFYETFENYENKIYEENKRKKKVVIKQEDEVSLSYKSKAIKVNNSGNGNSNSTQNNYEKKFSSDYYEIEIPQTEPNGLVGLQNVGATGYMNSTLQCFSNIRSLRNYFLKHKSKIKGKKLSSALLKIFENLWEKSNISCFVPNELKDVINEMNPLLDEIHESKDKDFVLFILNNIHNELNEENYNIKENNERLNSFNYNSVFNNFKISFAKNYNSIISNLFYGMSNSMMKCCSCNSTAHNIQCFNILSFALEEVKKFKESQNVINIYDCFDFYQKQDFMIGENKINCNLCHRLSNSINQTKIIISPNILIINLDRGKGIKDNIKISFDEYLELKNYIYYPESPHFYELIGIICHLNSSDMNKNFIAFCKNSENIKWYKFNDEIVKESNIIEALNCGIPYVLFYNYIKS